MITTSLAKTILRTIGIVTLFILGISHPTAAQSAKADDGQKLYEQNCAKCHGPDGSGNTQIGKAVGAKDLRAPEALKLTDAQIATQIQQGKGNMPPLSSLGKVQIDAIIPYVRGLAKKQTASKKTQ